MRNLNVALLEKNENIKIYDFYNYHLLLLYNSTFVFITCNMVGYLSVILPVHCTSALV